MRNVTHIELSGELSRLELSHEFAEPFSEDKGTRINNITTLYRAGLMSLETAIEMLAFTDKTDEEIQRILKEKEEAQRQAQQAAKEE